MSEGDRRESKGEGTRSKDRMESRRKTELNYNHRVICNIYFQIFSKIYMSKIFLCEGV